MVKWCLVFGLVFLPLFLLRLFFLPVFRLPENQEVVIVGRVSQQPYLKGSYQIISLGQVKVITERFPRFFYGQRLQVSGKLERKVINPLIVGYSAYFPQIQPVQKSEVEKKDFHLRAVLLKVRNQIESKVAQLLPEPQASLLLGILFGIKSQMSEEFLQNLRETGTLHVVVASGQNVTMVARFLIAGLVWVVSRRKALVLAIFGVFFYILMVGAEAPVLRAGIMAFLAYLGQILGREEEGSLALVLAAGLMVLFSPYLLFDLGFQLSFAATGGILWVYPRLVKKGKRLFGLPVLGEGLAITLSAQIGVLPILLANFGQVSLFSPLVNALVIWVVPYVMVLGSALAFLAFFIKPVALLLSWFVWLFLTYFVEVVNLAGSLPWASFEIGRLSFWWGAGYYFVLGFFLLKGRTNERGSF